MSKLLQWVIGICVVLVTAALIFSAVLPLFAGRIAFAGRQAPGGMFDGRMYGHMFGRGMMGGFGFPFFGFGGFLWPLLIGLIAVIGIVLLVRDLGRPRASQVQVASQPMAAAVPPVVTTPCSNCGRPLQAGWVACPYCGEKVGGSA
jgi:hypothetical protein